MKKDAIRDLVMGLEPHHRVVLLEMLSAPRARNSGTVILRTDNPAIFVAPPDLAEAERQMQSILAGEDPKVLTVVIYRLGRQDFNMFVDPDAWSCIKGAIAAGVTPRVGRVERKYLTPREYELVPVRQQTDPERDYFAVRYRGTIKAVTCEQPVLDAMRKLGVVASDEPIELPAEESV